MGLNETGNPFREDTPRRRQRAPWQLSAGWFRSARCAGTGVVSAACGDTWSRTALRLERVGGAGRSQLDGLAIAQAAPETRRPHDRTGRRRLRRAGDRTDDAAAVGV